MAPRLSADAAILHIKLLATNEAIPTACPWTTLDVTLLGIYLSVHLSLYLSLSLSIIYRTPQIGGVGGTRALAHSITTTVSHVRVQIL